MTALEELVDLDVDLDLEGVCDYPPEECSRAPEWAVIPACCKDPWPLCTEHKESIVHNAEMILTSGGLLECVKCGTDPVPEPYFTVTKI